MGKSVEEMNHQFCLLCNREQPRSLVLGTLKLSDLQSIRREVCEESRAQGPDLCHLLSPNNKVIFFSVQEIGSQSLEARQSREQLPLSWPGICQ